MKGTGEKGMSNYFVEKKIVFKIIFWARLYEGICIMNTAFDGKENPKTLS